jgi:hypothetical protein
MNKAAVLCSCAPGTTTEGREALRTVLEFLHRGDVLMVTRIDRFARSIGDLQDIVRTVRAKGASLKATEPVRALPQTGPAFAGACPGTAQKGIWSSMLPQPSRSTKG